jgi:hypothetical protein
VRVEVPIGDVVDRVTILAIKVLHLGEPARLNAIAEAEALRAAWREAGHPALESLPEWDRLHAVNRALWDVEDALRACERAADFGPGFVALARSVYRLNDERAALKRAINLRLGSRLLEEKSYGPGVGDRT